MENKKKRGGGRPSSFKPEFCEQLVAHMSEGLSFETFGAVIDVAEKTLYNWTEKYPEFLQAKEKGFLANKYFWERAGINGMKAGKDFNAVVWIFNMKNRFRWRDQVDVTSDEKPIMPQPVYVLVDNKSDKTAT